MLILSSSPGDKNGQRDVDAAASGEGADVVVDDGREYHMVLCSCIEQVLLRVESDDAGMEEPAEEPGREGESASASSSLGEIDMDFVKKREEENVRLACERARRIGRGVSAKAQELFDALSKTMPCRWAGEAGEHVAQDAQHSSIVVMDQVIVREPYTSVDCASLPTAAGHGKGTQISLSLSLSLS